MQPYGLRPEQEAAVSLVCSSRRNMPTTGSWTSSPRESAAPPTKEGSPCPWTPTTTSTTPSETSYVQLLPRGGDRLPRVRSADRVTPLQEPGPRKLTEAVVGLLSCYARAEAIRRRLPSLGKRPDPATGLGPAAWRITGVRSLNPLGVTHFRQDVAKRSLAVYDACSSEDRGCCWGYSGSWRTCGLQ